MQESRGITRGEVLLIVGLTALGILILWFIAKRSGERLLTQNCASNVRELGMALAEYSYDHDGVPPPFTNIEARFKTRRSNRTDVGQPQQLRDALRIYADEIAFFCPEDRFAKQSRLYLGINHQFTSYAFPSYRASSGAPYTLNQIPTSQKYGLLWDAAGDRQSCEDDLWLAGNSRWASNHRDGFANVVLADLSIHYLAADVVGKFER